MKNLILSALLCLLALGVEASEAGAHSLRTLKLGDAFPAFALKDAQGRSHSLADYTGKLAVLCYFRPGQLFSDQALDMLDRLHARYGSRGAAFLAVYHPDAQEPAKLKPRAYPILSDGGREAYAAWGLFIMPTTIFIDKERRVRGAWGSYSEDIEDEMTRAISAALGIKEESRMEARKPTGSVESPQTGLARRLLADRQPQQALDALAPTLQSADAGCDMRLLAGEALLKLGRPADAKPQAQACLTLEPASPTAALLMGRVLLETDDLGNAESWLKKATLGPDPSKARFALGQLYEKIGKKDQAIKEYRTALERLLGR